MEHMKNIEILYIIINMFLQEGQDGMKDYLTKEKQRKCRVHILALLCIVGIGAMAGCGNQDETDAAGTDAAASNEVSTEKVLETEITSVEDVNAAIAEFQEKYVLPGADIGNSVIEGDLQTIDGVTLGMLVPEDESERMVEWEGYTERELGMLSPEVMPNCQQEQSGLHYIIFNEMTYLYVNDLNAQGMGEDYKQYANVWVARGEKGAITVLGGLEEYGKQCAQEGQVTE